MIELSNSGKYSLFSISFRYENAFERKIVFFIHPVEYSVKEDTALCFVCCLFPTGVGREISSDAWVKGVKGWDKMKSVSKERKREISTALLKPTHKAALNDLAQFPHSMKHVDVMLNKQMSAAKIQEEENNQ